MHFKNHHLKNHFYLHKFIWLSDDCMIQWKVSPLNVSPIEFSVGLMPINCMCSDVWSNLAKIRSILLHNRLVMLFILMFKRSSKPRIWWCNWCNCSFIWCNINVNEINFIFSKIAKQLVDAVDGLCCLCVDKATIHHLTKEYKHKMIFMSIWQDSAMEPRLVEPETEFKIVSTLQRIHSLRRSSHIFTWRMILYTCSITFFIGFVYLCKYFKEQRDLEKNKHIDMYMTPTITPVELSPVTPSGVWSPELKREINMSHHFGMGMRSEMQWCVV